MKNIQKQNRKELSEQLDNNTLTGLVDLCEIEPKYEGKQYRLFLDVLDSIEEKYGSWIRGLYYFSKLIDASYYNDTIDPQNSGIVQMNNSGELGTDECNFIMNDNLKTNYLELDIVKLELNKLSELIKEEESFANTTSLDRLIDTIKIRIDMEDSLDRNSDEHKKLFKKFNDLMDKENIELDLRKTNIYFLNPTNSEVNNLDDIENFEELMGEILNGNDSILFKILQEKYDELMLEKKEREVTLIIGDILVQTENKEENEIIWPENFIHPMNVILSVEKDLDNKLDEDFRILTYSPSLIIWLLNAHISKKIKLKDNKFYYKNSNNKTMEINMDGVKYPKNIDELEDLF